MKVNEVFYSIQGESSFAGLPCAFIRLAGCDLRCTYCDTRYAFDQGTEMSVSEILKSIGEFATRLVLVTGGEPLLQKSVHELFQRLLKRNYTVLLETGGYVSLADVDPRVHKIMDFKCPSSGMESHNLYDNTRYLTLRDEVKFVVGDKKDFDWACTIIRRYALTSLVGTVLFAPVYNQLSYATLADWILNCRMGVRLQLQLHRIIWPDIERGV